MFNKTLGFVAVAAALTGLGLASTTTANAADTTTPTPTSNSTVADVTLNNDTSTGAGGITLTKTPNIHFGEATLTGSNLTQDGTLDSDVIVTNPGVASGWTVTLASDPMYKDADSTKNADGTDDTTTKQALAGGTYTLTTGGAGATIESGDTNKTTALAKDIVIPTGASSSALVMSAAVNQGIGTWNANYNTTTKLSVPSQTQAGSYSQNLTWTLTNSVVA